MLFVNTRYLTKTSKLQCLLIIHECKQAGFKHVVVFPMQGTMLGHVTTEIGL